MAEEHKRITVKRMAAHLKLLVLLDRTRSYKATLEAVRVDLALRPREMARFRHISHMAYSEAQQS